jgi:hypothetical protein
MGTQEPGGGRSTQQELDAQGEAAARVAAEDGARRARERGWDAEGRLATEWRAIVDVADEIDAGLLVVWVAWAYRPARARRGFIPRGARSAFGDFAGLRRTTRPA